MNQKMCEECGKKPANVHLTQIVHSETSVWHICEDCARKKGINIEVTGHPQVETQPEKDINCPRCRMSFSEFREKGRLGCVECYHSFSDDVNEYLMQAHGSRFHRGKRYGANRRVSSLPGDVARLRKELDRAVQNEDFELAAALRDRIQDLGTTEPCGEGKTEK